MELSVKKKKLSSNLSIYINIHLFNNNQYKLKDVLIILSQMQIYSQPCNRQVYMHVYQSIEISHSSVHMQSSRHPSWLNFIHVASNRVN